MSNIIVTTVSKKEIEQLIEKAIKKTMIGFLKGKSIEKSIFLDVDEASQFLGIAKATLYGKCSGKLIPHIKKGKRLYFDQNELVIWLKSGKRKTLDNIENEANSHLRNRQFR